MIKVLIADDSAFMRMVLSDLFKKQPDFEVLDTARNGKEAYEKALRLKPDLVTMDVNMPVMDGLDALRHIMEDCPTAVIMCSSLTKDGADATMKALSLGAVDFINKTGGSIMRIDSIEDEILAKFNEKADNLGIVMDHMASSITSITESVKQSSEAINMSAVSSSTTNFAPHTGQNSDT